MKPAQYPRCIVRNGLALALFLASGIASQSLYAQKFKVLYAFKGSPDGALPYTENLIRDAAGNIYGTTINGGDSGNGTCTAGCGTVFKVDPSGHETILYRFGQAPPDGNFPTAGLVRDSSGNLYGTTYWGGTDTIAGTVFKLTERGAEAVLYSFQAGTDGYQPQSNLLRDSAGNLFGTTQDTVFKVTESGQKTNLHVFTRSPDGYYPLAGLTRDAEGNLYGTSQVGGNNGCNGNIGCGTVFKLDSSGKETVLYKFSGGRDGEYPQWGNLALGPDGSLYGTTFGGGLISNKCGVLSSCGVVFRLSKTGKLTVLYRFRGGSDGFGPYSSVTRDNSGNLYGTLYLGGNCCGLVFKLTKAGKIRCLHKFSGGDDGSQPLGQLTLDRAGNIYGTTPWGGRYNNGVVFKISP
jgi:uncharacterized repeat protein (TIGR03803 family)